MPSSDLQRFIDCETDDGRLALGADVLRAAKREADESGLLGWSDAIHEYVYAIESGKGLNRPL